MLNFTIKLTTVLAAAALVLAAGFFTGSVLLTGLAVVAAGMVASNILND